MLAGVNLFAQTNDETPQMKYFRGGIMNINAKLNLNFNNAGNGSGFSGIFSSKYNLGPANIFSNPAQIGTSGGSQIYFEATPGFNIGSMLNSSLNDGIKSGTDDFLKDTSTFKFGSNNYKSYTSSNDFVLGRQSGLNTLAFTLPIAENFNLGFGFMYPLDINLNLASLGIQTYLQSVKDVSGKKTTIDILLNPNIGLDYRLRMSTLSFGLAGQINNKEFGDLKAGVSFNRYSVYQSYTININIDGYILLNKTQEYNFNDPNDLNFDAKKGETNSFYMKGQGSFSQSKWGFNAGVSYHNPGLNFIMFSLAANINPKFSVNDKNAFMESYQPKFLKGKITGQDADAMDMIIDSLDLARPTLTVETNNELLNQMNFYLPSSVCFGIDLSFYEHTFTINAIKYFGEFSYQLGKYKVGKKLDAGVKFGFNFKMPAEFNTWGIALIPIRLLFLDIDGLLMQAFGSQTGFKDLNYRLEGGIVTGSSIVEGFSDDFNNDISSILNSPLPSEFMMRRTYTILDRIKISALILGLPDVGLKVGIGFGL